ncbi:hypothetical protein QN277_021088 [Acacia crassicarpa]|uniref:Uncharacterized protein n=1 Tax=Acacia crassicarpa TaxID=499986 RepID=A0AAE1JKT4_9FABA|nr:hypothetical protein QN277_021088 [Acacia crassicarpa]
MGLYPPSQLSLDLRSTFCPKMITDFLYEVSAIANSFEKLLTMEKAVASHGGIHTPQGIRERATMVKPISDFSFSTFFV